MKSPAGGEPRRAVERRCGRSWGGRAVPTVATFDALLSGYSWNGVGVAGRPTFVTFSFDATWSAAFSETYSAAFLSSFQAFSAADQEVARRALQAWGDASGLTFLEVPAG